MQRRRFLNLLPAAALARAQEPGFVSLFDGRTLDGWVVRDGPESAFYVDNGDIVVHQGSNFPAWLASTREYENFDFRGQFFVRNWTDSGIYLHAPETGYNTEAGIEVNLFHRPEDPPTSYSCGAVFPVIAPSRVNVKPEWNDFRIRMDWPRLQVWMNGDMVQDLDCHAAPELRYRLRRGFLGFQSLSYPIRFRNLRIQELPPKEKWETLYGAPADLANWRVSEGKPRFSALGGVLRLEGLGHIATRGAYRDFILQSYVRTSRWHNGGIVFRSEGKGTRGRSYEIQLHNVEGAHFPTGSLYHYRRARYPRIEDERWWLLQLIVQDRTVVVRVNGETILDYSKLENLDAGVIELQAHHEGTWCEFKRLQVRSLA